MKTSAVKILLSTVHARWPYKRQTPGQSMIWEKTAFFLNNHEEKTDFLVVYDEPHERFKTDIPQERRFLFISEPPSIKKYDTAYLNQFGLIFTPMEIQNLDPDIIQIVGQLALPWHYNVSHANRFEDYADYDALKALKPAEKKQKISTVISSKTMNESHRQRIKTVQFLKERLGERFHLFGRGYYELDNKADGIDAYAFHLVCENNDVPHFWTEKLADAYLGWSFPFFSGCSNIADYFPEESFISVDLKNPEETLNKIKTVLDDSDFFEKRLPALEKARELVLDKYNLFSVIADTIEARNWEMSKTLSEPQTLNPQTRDKNAVKKIIKKLFALSGKVFRRLKNLRFFLPLYFKIINRDPSFFTDYHDRAGKTARENGYYGQRGQDWFIDQKIFNGKEKGIFLDVGANDPHNLNNTLYFEKKNWSGLAFEPQERFRKKWENTRKTPCLPHLLGASEGENVTFIEYDTEEWQNALSGVEGYALESGVNLENVDAKRVTLSKRRLDHVLEEHGISHADFMSLDVEGFEMEVLQGIDFEKIRIDVIVVENDRTHLGDTKLRTFIKSKGYRHVARLSGDDVFTRIGSGL